MMRKALWTQVRLCHVQFYMYAPVCLYCLVSMSATLMSSHLRWMLLDTATVGLSSQVGICLQVAVSTVIAAFAAAAVN